MTIQDRLSEIEEWNKATGCMDSDTQKLVEALRVAANVLQRQSNPHSSELFCKDRAKEALTEIELILSGYSKAPEGRKRILNSEGEG